MFQRHYLEIGTSDFDTLNDRFFDNPHWSGISIEPVKEYYDNLKKYDKNIYRNLVVVGSSCAPDTLPIYTVASKTIQTHNLPSWLRGCSALSQSNPSLQKYKEYVTKEEVKTISVEQLFKNIKCHVDLLKVDTEGEDFSIVNQVLKLGHRPTHIIFETCFMVDSELIEIYELLRKNNYDFIKRVGDSVQFSKKSVLLIADTNWSTGSISKDLQHLSHKWQVSILDWNDYKDTSTLQSIFNEFDAVICFTLNAPVAWPILRDYSVICCGEIEINAQILPVAEAYGTVSPTIYSKLARLSSHPIFYTPASARLSRFRKRDHKTLNTLGFAGLSTPRSVKNVELFQDICTVTQTNGLISEKHFTYDNINKFYDQIDLLVCTSHTEGGPLPVFEAIASGVPVISTPVGLTLEMTTIPKFSELSGACDLIKEYKSNSRKYTDLIENQYQELKRYYSMEVFLHYWEKFFEGSKKKTTVMI